MSRQAGETQRRRQPKTAAQTAGKRPRRREVPPLFSTYDAPKPAGAYFDKAAGNRAVRWIESNLRHYQGKSYSSGDVAGERG